jgi:hypothetical protein
LKFLKTDGDGMFMSKSFEDRMRHKFIHQMSAPEDHNSNSEIEREIRTVFEGTTTALTQSGAPAAFWGEAQNHFVFTKNVLPLVPVKEGEGYTYKSARNILDPSSNEFNLNFLVAFGTQCTCYIPKEGREGGKQPAQKKSFSGAVVGYVSDMNAYRVYDFEKRKIRKISVP